MFRRQPQHSHGKGEEENPYLLSFADIMAGLLGLFILALISVMVLLDKQRQTLKEKTALTEQKAEELRGALKELGNTISSLGDKISGISAYESARTDLLKGIQTALSQEGIVVKTTADGLRIPDETLSFPKGSYVIPPDKRRNAERIGEILSESLQKPEHADLLDTVFIEGHTDSVPNRKDMGNWGLSTYRAISLWNFWTDGQGQLASLRQQKNAVGEPLFSVSGYADTRAVVPPPEEALRFLNLPALPPEGMALLDEPRNRRIDLRFTLRGSESVRSELQKEVTELKRLEKKIQATLEGQ
jgi:flagellar motor protein MotB